MFPIKFSQPIKAVVLSCALACAGVSSNAVADDKQTYGALAVDQSQSDREFQREARSKRVQEWQIRMAERREAFLKRFEERREGRVTALRTTRETDRDTRVSHRQYFGRDDEETGVWAGFKSWKKGAVEAKTSKRNPSTPKGKYGSLISKYAKQHGVPYSLARAVVQVESTFRPNVTGGAGEIGLMQIKLATARGMGYKGTRKQLYDPATNLYWGMKYLGKAYQLAGGNTCGTILRYNAGHYAKRMNKISARYCGKVKRILA